MPRVAVFLTSAVAGVSLHLERLVLVGFQLSPPDVQQAPVLWPGGLVPGSGEQLNMTDVRVVINSQELFNKYLTSFTASNTLLWTVSQPRVPYSCSSWCSCTAVRLCSSEPQLVYCTSPGEVSSQSFHVFDLPAMLSNTHAMRLAGLQCSRTCSRHDLPNLLCSLDVEALNMISSFL